MKRFLNDCLRTLDVGLSGRNKVRLVTSLADQII
jgi:hypothetical protein